MLRTLIFYQIYLENAPFYYNYFANIDQKFTDKIFGAAFLQAGLLFNFIRINRPLFPVITP